MNGSHAAPRPPSQFAQFLELIRFSHTVFALPFALLAAVLAWRVEPFRWNDLLGIGLCMVFARSAAMAFNRLADRRIDASNSRTAGRHLPAGLLSAPVVTVFAVLCSVGFVASTTLFLIRPLGGPNWWPLILSVPVLLFLLSYSLAKRFTMFCHYWLGAALMLSPVAAWIALRGNVEITPVLLGCVVLFWVGGFDVIYACQDVEHDRENGLFSIPARFGVAAALRIAAISHLAAVASLAGLWYAAGLGPVFLAGIVGVAALLVYEHSLVRADDLTRVNAAFFQVNAVISIGLFAVGVADVLIV